jgi:hypothetical protein
LTESIEVLHGNKKKWYAVGDYHSTWAGSVSKVWNNNIFFLSFPFGRKKPIISYYLAL